MEETIFDKIINKQLPAEIVHEDEMVLAFKDIYPQAPIHVLVIPKQKCRSFADLENMNEGAVGRYMQAIAKIAKKLTGDSGYRVVFNIGKDGRQTVNYLHAHILGGKQLAWNPA